MTVDKVKAWLRQRILEQERVNEFLQAQGSEESKHYGMGRLAGLRSVMEGIETGEALEQPGGN